MVEYIQDIAQKQQLRPVEHGLENLQQVLLDVGQLGDVARAHGHAGLAEDSIWISLKGIAGQSFGAWVARGVTLDLTGEPEFVDRMWLEHNSTAERSGARLVHACGFDSVPHDLGAQFPLTPTLNHKAHQRLAQCLGLGE